jgi:hypothetical protein
MFATNHIIPREARKSEFTHPVTMDSSPGCGNLVDARSSIYSMAALFLPCGLGKTLMSMTKSGHMTRDSGANEMELAPQSPGIQQDHN